MVGPRSSPDTTCQNRMDLAEAFVNGIVKAGDQNRVTDHDYTRLLSKVFEMLLPEDGSDEDKDEANDSDDFKEACSGVLALVLEASRNNLDDSQLTLLLEEYGLGGERAAALTRKYAANSQRVRLGLGQIAHPPPHVTDVDWAVDYRYKSSHLERLGDPVFQVELKSSQPVAFACNLAQMEDLLHCLRDAVKCVENKSLGGGS